MCGGVTEKKTQRNAYDFWEDKFREDHNRKVYSFQIFDECRMQNENKYGLTACIIVFEWL